MKFGVTITVFQCSDNVSMFEVLIKGFRSNEYMKNIEISWGMSLLSLYLPKKFEENILNQANFWTGFALLWGCGYGDYEWYNSTRNDIYH